MEATRRLCRRTSSDTGIAAADSPGWAAAGHVPLTVRPSLRDACAEGGPQRFPERPTPREVRLAVTVGGSEPRNRPGREAAGQLTLDVPSGEGADAAEARVGMAGEVVDVPVTDVVAAGRAPPVSVHACEPARSERAPDVDVAAGGEGVSAESADAQLDLVWQLEHERVGAAVGRGHG